MTEADVRLLSQSDVEVMTEEEDSASSRRRDLNRLAIKAAINRRIASIECDDVR